MKSDGTRRDSPPAPIQPVGFFTGVQIRPVILGVIVDYIATFAVMQAYLALFVARSVSRDGEAPGVAPQSMSSNDLLMIAFVIGSLGTALGGVVAARKAGVFGAKHGAFVGLGSLIVSFVELLMQEEPPSAPEWFRMISVLAIIPAGADRKSTRLNSSHVS